MHLLQPCVYLHGTRCPHLHCCPADLALDAGVAGWPLDKRSARHIRAAHAGNVQAWNVSASQHPAAGTSKPSAPTLHCCRSSCCLVAWLLWSLAASPGGCLSAGTGSASTRRRGSSFRCSAVAGPQCICCPAKSGLVPPCPPRLTRAPGSRVGFVLSWPPVLMLRHSCLTLDAFCLWAS